MKKIMAAVVSILIVILAAQASFARDGEEVRKTFSGIKAVRLGSVQVAL